MKQLSLAMITYAQDYDETFYTQNGGNGARGWAQRVYPYIKSKGAYVCPDDVVTPNSAISYAANQNIGDNTNGVNSSQVNQWLQPARSILLVEITGASAASGFLSGGQYDVSNLASTADSPVTEDGYLQPSGIGWGDFGYAGGLRQFSNTTANAVLPVCSPPACHSSCPKPVGRHTDGAMWAMADGHVKWLKPDQVSTGRGQPSNNCNQDNSPSVTGCNAATNKPWASGTDGFLCDGSTRPVATMGIR
jgi:prepilin-type processing-associated H-X9-DG protein